MRVRRLIRSAFRRTARRALRRVGRAFGRPNQTPAPAALGGGLAAGPAGDTVLCVDGFDDDGVICQTVDGQRTHNIFEVALQAMIGRRVLWPYGQGRKGLKARYYDIHLLPSPAADPSARAALEWLERRGQPGPDGSHRWLYHFDVRFGGVHVPGPWPCAFGQAYAVLAFLLWHRHTSDPRWLRRAAAGARLFGVPSEDGGLATVFPDGTLCIEEVPAPANTHILNAHVVSLLALAEVLAVEDDPHLRSLLQHGLDYLRTAWQKYDTGYWSRYDLPSRDRLLLRVCPAGADAEILLGAARLTAGGRALASLDLAGDDAFADAPCRASGVDFGHVVSKKTFRGRQVLYGPALHPEAVATGTRQNTYLTFHADLSGAGEDLALELECAADRPATVAVEFRDLSRPDPAFRAARPEHRINLTGGVNRLTLPIARGDFGQPLSEEYHRFHVTMLDLLAERTGDETAAMLAGRFRQYAEDVRRPAPIAAGDLPETAYLAVNTECGLACKMCDLGSGQADASLFRNLRPDRKKVQMDPDLLVRRFADAAGQRLTKVHFIGTEPLLYKPIFRVVKDLRRLGYETVVTTNGINLPKVADQLIDCDLDALWVSVDGPPAVHDDIRGLKGLFARIDEGMSRLRRAAEEQGRDLPPIYLSGAVSNLNQHALVEMMEAIEAWPIRSVTFTHLNYVTEPIARTHCERFPDWPIGPSTVNEFVRPEQVDCWGLYCQIQQAKRRWPGKAVFVPDTDFDGIVDLYHRPDRPVGRPVCQVPWLCMEINANGDVVAMSRCYRRILGNIHEQHLAEIWQGQPYRALREFIQREGLLPPCYRCCAVL